MTTSDITPETLDEKLVDPDPIKQFQAWFSDAIAANLPLPEAMNLATATPEGRPSSRMVLLKQVDEDGFVFFTNYHSAKAQQLESNPYAALVFYWPQLDRQVRIEGKVERTSVAESAVDDDVENEQAWIPEEVRSDQPVADDSLVNAKQSLAEAVDEMVGVLSNAEVRGSIGATDRANLAKYLTIAKLRLENAIALVRSEDPGF